MKQTILYYAKLVIIMNVLLIIMYAFVSCAPAPNSDIIEKTTIEASTTGNVNVERVIANWSYTVDYMEDLDRDMGCYIYDGNESGNIFCFSLDQ